jgi:hypothetical protein
LKGLKLGVYKPWFQDADLPVKDQCNKMLALLGEWVLKFHWNRFLHSNWAQQMDGFVDVSLRHYSPAAV